MWRKLGNIETVDMHDNGWTIDIKFNERTRRLYVIRRNYNNDINTLEYENIDEEFILANIFNVRIENFSLNGPYYQNGDYLTAVDGSENIYIGAHVSMHIDSHERLFIVEKHSIHVFGKWGGASFQRSGPNYIVNINPMYTVTSFHYMDDMYIYVTLITFKQTFLAAINCEKSVPDDGRVKIIDTFNAATNNFPNVDEHSKLGAMYNMARGGIVCSSDSGIYVLMKKGYSLWALEE